MSVCDLRKFRHIPKSRRPRNSGPRRITCSPEDTPCPRFAKQYAASSHMCPFGFLLLGPRPLDECESPHERTPLSVPGEYLVPERGERQGAPGRGARGSNRCDEGSSGTRVSTNSGPIGTARRAGSRCGTRGPPLCRESPRLPRSIPPKARQAQICSSRSESARSPDDTRCPKRARVLSSAPCGASQRKICAQVARAHRRPQRSARKSPAHGRRIGRTARARARERDAVVGEARRPRRRPASRRDPGRRGHRRCGGQELLGPMLRRGIRRRPWRERGPWWQRERESKGRPETRPKSKARVTRLVHLPLGSPRRVRAPREGSTAGFVQERREAECGGHPKFRSEMRRRGSELGGSCHRIGVALALRWYRTCTVPAQHQCCTSVLHMHQCSTRVAPVSYQRSAIAESVQYQHSPSTAPPQY